MFTVSLSRFVILVEMAESRGILLREVETLKLLKTSYI